MREQVGQRVADHFASADEIATDVAQQRVLQTILGAQVKEHRAAAQKGLGVAEFALWHQRAQRRQQLALAADPLQKWRGACDLRFRNDPQVRCT